MVSVLKVDDIQTTAGSLYIDGGVGEDALLVNAESPVKAWLVWDTDSSHAITDDLNVSSITDEGTGKTRVDYTTAMSQADYVVSGCACKNDGNDDGNMIVAIGGYNNAANNPNETGHCHVRTIFPTGANVKDVNYQSIAVVL